MLLDVCVCGDELCLCARVWDVCVETSCVSVRECEMCVWGDTCTGGWHLLLVCAPESNMITRAWMPAGSWTAWRWRTWTGLTCASTSPATTGWARTRQTTCLWETCWALLTPWTCPNVCAPFHTLVDSFTRPNVCALSKRLLIVLLVSREYSDRYYLLLESCFPSKYLRVPLWG